MFEIILISRHATEDFDLNQRALRAGPAKNGGIVQILRESFRFTVRKPYG
jgi:hypothetical protein